jgi:hypothetical protein
MIGGDRRKQPVLCLVGVLYYYALCSIVLVGPAWDRWQLDHPQIKGQKQAQQRKEAGNKKELDPPFVFGVGRRAEGSWK